MEKYEPKAEKCVVSIDFKPNKTFWIATNTNYIDVPNTNFTLPYDFLGFILRILSSI